MWDCGTGIERFNIDSIALGFIFSERMRCTRTERKTSCTGWMTSVYLEFVLIHCRFPFPPSLYPAYNCSETRQTLCVSFTGYSFAAGPTAVISLYSRLCHQSWLALIIRYHSRSARGSNSILSKKTHKEGRGQTWSRTPHNPRP